MYQYYNYDIFCTEFEYWNDHQSLKFEKNAQCTPIVNLNDHCFLVIC